LGDELLANLVKECNMAGLWMTLWTTYEMPKAEVMGQKAKSEPLM
jgi:hypothetical protein